MKQRIPGLYLFAAAFILSLVVSPTARAQSEEIAKGKVIEKVICAGDAGQSYALYLPSSYTPERKWPLLLAFDPAARGRVPVERFKEAAERFGYIVAGSNNSRNGPEGNPSAAFNAMWRDTRARFAVDERRIYATGFSGGARVAANVGYALKGKVAGVIGCGAGFPQEIHPSKDTPFAFFGITGVEDFNYIEVKEVGRKLDAAGVPNRIAVFEGGHDWPPSETCIAAIEWMELQAIRSGLGDKDQKIIDELYKRELAKAESSESSGMTYQAYAIYERAARDFNGLKDTGELESKAAQLKDQKEVRQAVKQEKEMEAEQSRTARRLFALRAVVERQSGALAFEAESLSDSTAASTEDRLQALSSLRRTLADLKKRSEARESSTERAVARRSLNQYLILSYERAQSFLAVKRFDQAIAALSIDAEAMPDNWRVLYNLAIAYSLNGDKKRAIETLKKAVQKGFADRAELERNRSLDPLREEAGFKKIIEELVKKTT